jgi:hypothetical protein
MAIRRARARKGRIITVDFSKVEDQKLVDEGEYNCRVVSVEEKEGDKAPYLAWKFEIESDDDANGAILYNNTSLSEQSLWNLRNLIECMGHDAPKKVMDLDLDDFIDNPVGLVVVHDDSYDGKPRNKVSGYFGVEEGEPEEEKPQRSARKGRDGEATTTTTTTRRGRAAKEKELDKLDQGEVADMNEGELEDVVEKYKLDVDLDDHKTLRRKANAVIDALEGANHLS